MVFFRSSSKGGRYWKLAFRLACGTCETPPFHGSAFSLLTRSRTSSALNIPNSWRRGSHTTILSAHTKPRKGEDPSRCCNRSSRPLLVSSIPGSFGEVGIFVDSPKAARIERKKRGAGTTDKLTFATYDDHPPSTIIQIVALHPGQKPGFFDPTLGRRPLRRCTGIISQFETPSREPLKADSTQWLTMSDRK